MKKTNGTAHLVDVVEEWIDENEATHECFCVFADKDENGEELMSRVINGEKRIISAIINSMENSEAVRAIIMIAAKTFAYRLMIKNQKSKDITLN